MVFARNKMAKFQSTRPVWGATLHPLPVIDNYHNFNPRAPCGARLGADERTRLPDNISIHAPRVGRDVIAARIHDVGIISIHAPRVGRDKIRKQGFLAHNISIHAPRVGRDTPKKEEIYVAEISIHAPRVGRDGLLTL